MRPLLLDLFCGAGGAAMGYHRAGFDVVGVDIKPQPHYPFEFVQADALRALEYARDGFTGYGGFEAIHASPPCQRYSDLAYRNGNADEHPDLVGPVRELLESTGLPWVIENVPEAPLVEPVILCGTMFEGLRVIRHRAFEANWHLAAHPKRCPPRHPLCHTLDKRKAHYGKTDEWADFVTVTGGGNCSTAAARDAMGMPWGGFKAGLNEAIPPAYTEYVGRRLYEHVLHLRHLEAVRA